MKEDFLNYVWQYMKLDAVNLKTVKGESLQIFHVGQCLKQTGPDFFNAQILIENQKWAGNVEIHVKSSDWYLHNHEKDSNYNNVILHVVWEHDTDVFRKDNTEIPVLELKNYVCQDLLNQYQKLKSVKSWIHCENQIKDVSEFSINNWLERLFFERLEIKSDAINKLLLQNKNDWEATFFICLTKNFGLNSNGNSFCQMASSIPYTIIRKEAFDVHNLEALFYGTSNLLVSVKEDNYYKDLQSRWKYMEQKYQLKSTHVEAVQFFKLRPDNFPTIRLSQLAGLYHSHQNLFSKIIKAKTVEELYAIFNIQASHYWDTHYLFDKISIRKRKKISKAFIDLLVINTIVSFKFAYHNSIGKSLDENILEFLCQISSEKNTVIDKFNQMGIQSKTAFTSQSLLHLKKEYCDKSRCLECAVGIELLKN